MLIVFSLLVLSANTTKGQYRVDRGITGDVLPQNSIMAVKIEIKPGEPGLYREPKPFIVGDLFSFRVVMTNLSNEMVKINARDVLFQERPELRKDGKLLLYRTGASGQLQPVELPKYDPRRPGLVPQQSKDIASVVLNDWYDSLSQGSYLLTVRYRFEPKQEWLDSAIIFDVLPSAPGLSKTPFTSDSLAAIDDDVVRSVSAKRPAWRHERGTPITGSEDIILDYWITGRKRVQSYILELPSPEEATRRLQSQYGEANERLPDLGDEGLVRSGNIVAFRKGRLEIEVLAGIHSKAEFGEQVKLSKEFARDIAAALPASGLYKKVVLHRPYAAPSQVTITLASKTDPGERSISKLFKVGETKISFALVITNVSAEPLKAYFEFNHMQDRPELVREGQVVPYLDEVQKLVAENKESPDYQRHVIVLLQPNKPETFATINLKDWYAPLQPGHYRLNNKHRLVQSQVWIDCGSIPFEVVP